MLLNSLDTLEGETLDSVSGVSMSPNSLDTLGGISLDYPPDLPDFVDCGESCTCSDAGGCISVCSSGGRVVESAGPSGRYDDSYRDDASCLPDVSTEQYTGMSPAGKKKQ